MMTTRDLFELASLDTLGLLDEDERREFERAFRDAPPAVQAQIRREQLRTTDIESWLPQVAPPPGLKSSVMNAVQEAVVAVRQGRARDHVRHKVGPLAMALQRNVSPLWRAASIGLIGGVVSLSYVLYKVNDQYRASAIAQRSDQSMDEAQRLGKTQFLETLDSPRSMVAFRDGEAKGPRRVSATLYVGSNDRAFLQVNNLPIIAGGYRLVAVGDDGAMKALKTFDVPGGRQVIELAATLIPMGARLAILPASAPDSLSAAILVS